MRVVVVDLDAQALEHGVGEVARRVVDRIGDQYVVAGRQEAEQRDGDGGKSGRHCDRAGRALEFVDRMAEGVRGGRSAGAVCVF